MSKTMAHADDEHGWLISLLGREWAGTRSSRSKTSLFLLFYLYIVSLNFSYLLLDTQHTVRFA